MTTYFDTAELVGVLSHTRTPPRFFLDRYFKRSFLSTRETIAFDEVLDGLPAMAPFVSPIVQAKPQRMAGQSMKAFQPAYVKPKHFVKPADFIKRAPGEPIGINAASGEARMQDAVIDILAYQKKQIEARWEWLAAKAIIDGKVMIVSEDYPAVEVDFGRAPGNRVILDGAGNVWSDVTTPIGDQLEDWSDAMLEATGFAATDVIMSPEAWRAFKENEAVRRDLDVRRGVSAVPDVQPKAGTEGVKYVGAWGEFNIYVHTGRFREQDGSIVRALDAGEVLVTAAPSTADGSGGAEGIRAFGAIQDVEAQLQAAEIFPKQWEEKDPSGMQIMSQSAPLMIPGRPNSTMKIKVL